MSKKKLFGNNIKPSCKYCESATSVEGNVINFIIKNSTPKNQRAALISRDKLLYNSYSDNVRQTFKLFFNACGIARNVKAGISVILFGFAHHILDIHSCR